MHGPEKPTGCIHFLFLNRRQPDPKQRNFLGETSITYHFEYMGPLSCWWLLYHLKIKLHVTRSVFVKPCMVLLVMLHCFSIEEVVVTVLFVLFWYACRQTQRGPYFAQVCLYSIHFSKLILWLQLIYELLHYSSKLCNII